MIADYEGDIVKLFEGGNDGEYPILATRNLILFPAVVTPILIGRQQSLNLSSACSARKSRKWIIPHLRIFMTLVCLHASYVFWISPEAMET